MQIILVPGNANRRSRCLTKKGFALLMVLAVGIPVLVGIGAYRFGVSYATYQPSAEQLRLAYVQTTLENGQRQVQQAERGVEKQLDTLGRRLGHVQAHLLRLNALGRRLTDMASLDPDEFNFDIEPAVGGPSNSFVQDQGAADLIAALDALERSVQDKRGELEILETLLMDHELHSKQFPHGWPVRDGWISSGYGYRNDPFSGKRSFHTGVDIATKPGAPIHAVAAGVVTVSSARSGYGVMVEINHGKGYITRYAHALKADVETGDRVKKGDVVAIVGSTGRSTGAHLHFEVLRDSKAVNPLKYIRASL